MTNKKSKRFDWLKVWNLKIVFWNLIVICFFEHWNFYNMYTTPILWMISWPVVIIISYYAIKWAVKKYEAKLESEEVSEQSQWTVTVKNGSEHAQWAFVSAKFCLWNQIFFYRTVKCWKCKSMVEKEFQQALGF